MVCVTFLLSVFELLSRVLEPTISCRSKPLPGATVYCIITISQASERECLAETAFILCRFVGVVWLAGWLYGCTAAANDNKRASTGVTSDLLLLLLGGGGRPVVGR